MEELIIKPCPSYPDYFADNLGNVYSIKTNKPQIKRKELKKMTKSVVSGKRYYISVCKNLQKTRIPAAVMVLDAHVGPRPDGMFACHGPNGAFDDSINNLYWATPKQNQQDRLRDGTASIGEKHGNSVFTNEDVRNIRKLRNENKMSYIDIAKLYNVSLSAVALAANKKTWKHI